MLCVHYGNDEFYGDVRSIAEDIKRKGGVASPRLFTGALSTILEKQRKDKLVETMYPCIGVFTKDVESKTLVLVHPKLNNNIYDIGKLENNEAVHVLEQVKNKPLPQNEFQIRTLTSAYLKIPKYFTCLEAVIPLCYGIIQPFFYVLKREFHDYFCQLLLWSSGTKLGKSAIANSITEDLYGVQKKAIGHIDSPYRMMQTLNATTMPQHISEIQTFEFDIFSDVIKASAESMTLAIGTMPTRQKISSMVRVV